MKLTSEHAMTRDAVLKYFAINGITETIPRKGRQVVRVFGKWENRPCEVITAKGKGQFTFGLYAEGGAA